jgi:hypothetical protein
VDHQSSRQPVRPGDIGIDASTSRNIRLLASSHADQRFVFRVRPRVDVEDVLHLCDEACPVPFRDAPALLPPRLRFYERYCVALA